MGLTHRLDELMVRYSALGAAKVGRGPYHPTEPDNSLAEDLRVLLESYPFLRGDAGYVVFLERYAGAIINEPKKNLVIEIHGISDVSTNLLNCDVPPLEPGGYFALGGVDVFPGGVIDWSKIVAVGFTLEATGTRRPGIYRNSANRDNLSESLIYTWYCETFLDWLDRAISLKGQLL